MGGVGEREAACARGLAQLLVFGAGESGPSLDRLTALCAGDPEALSVLRARGCGDALPDGGEGPSREEAVRRTVRVRALAAEWQESLAERNIEALPLGGVAHVGRLHRGANRLVERAALLVSPFDASRARLVLATGGLERVAEPEAGRVVFRSEDLELELRWAFHPPGWSSLPTSPFFAREAPGDSPGPSRLMDPAADWAIHRLIPAAGLWRPGMWRPLDLAETAALGVQLGEGQRRRWGEMVRRWGAGRLWRRAEELERWLLGGGCPEWLAGALAGEPPRLAERLVLQDTPGRAALYLLRRALGRLGLSSGSR